MVGGDAGRMSIQGQLGNFDQFTDRLDAVSKSMMEDLPEAWDSTDKRILSMKETIQDGAQKVAELKPKVHDQLDNARKSIEDLRKNSAETVDAAQEKITTYRKDVRANTEEWGKLVAEYKDVIPQQVHDARTWTDGR
jgi:uncharacterized coiled-coil DUF342 family protein